PIVERDAKSVDANLPLITTGGPLTLEGLHFQHVEPDTKKGTYSLIASREAPLFVTHCRFFFTGSRFAVALHPAISPRLSVRHCEFAGHFGAAIAPRKLAPFGTIEVADCLC